ncbi:MAG: helix-turn-helix transcriptional regulator [Candidatus Schekmanbacteria bacterium]|nr:helix-turn-helix transcriptional regulator [Candidatus Schekmanbacteria bacterium]
MSDNPYISGGFEEDLARNLKEPEFKKAYQEELRQLDLASKIHNLRKEKKMTQAELARCIHSTQSVVSRIEQADYHQFKVETLEKIAAALDMALVIDFKPRKKVAATA